jgi:hypothetical protein
MMKIILDRKALRVKARRSRRENAPPDRPRGPGQRSGSLPVVPEAEVPPLPPSRPTALVRHILAESLAVRSAGVLARIRALAVCFAGRLALQRGTGRIFIRETDAALVEHILFALLGLVFVVGHDDLLAISIELS